MRHSGDPLLAALNLSNTPGYLNFGMSAAEERFAGFMFLIISLSILTVILYKFKSACPEYFMNETYEERYRKNINQMIKKQERYAMAEDDEGDDDEVVLDGQVILSSRQQRKNPKVNKQYKEDR